MANVILFNPLDRKNLGASVAEALLTNEVHLLDGLVKFSGAGIYAIYYTGDFEPYAELSKRNQNNRYEIPIYVGKAVPKGAQKGGDFDADPKNVLFNRLKNHAKSIRDAENLLIDDFHCRFLVIDDIWIPLGETLVIARFVPVWNTLIRGFGNNAPGKGREKGVRSRWDALHPGRPSAAKLGNRSETLNEIARDAQNYLRNAPLSASDRFVEAEPEPNTFNLVKWIEDDEE